MNKRLGVYSTDLRSASVLALAAATLLITAVLWVFAWRQMEADRSTAVQAEINKNTNLVLSHAERSSRSIQVLDQILLSVRTTYLSYGAPRDLNALLDALQVDRTHITVVAVMDERGQAVVSNVPNLPNYADRDYFKHHAGQVVDSLLIGQPILGRLTQRWVISLTRRINKPDGSFGGVVFMALSPQFFAAEFEKAVQGPFGSLALIGLDGITRARRNADRVSFGDDARASQLFKELPQNSEGHYLGVAASDGVRRLVAYRTLSGYPLVAVVASSYEDVIATTAGRERLNIATATGASLATVLAGLTGIGYLVRRRRTQSAIEDSERRYRLLFENSLDAVISYGPDGQLVAANPAACAMFQLDPQRLELISREQLLDPTDSRLAPLLLGEAEDGTLQGPVRMVRLDGSPFEAEVSSAAYSDSSGHTSMIVRDVSERRLAEDQIRHLAFYDSLTRLPNRRLLMDRLKLAMAASHRHHNKGALLFVDLDNFKVLNDTLGHLMGDLLLQQVAQRLLTCLREGDTCARLGGDEFVVMLEDLGEDEIEAAQQAESVGWKVLKALSQSYELGGAEHHSTPSIGITLFAGHEQAVDEPLKRADLAMYHAKAAGRNTLRFYDPQIQAVMSERAGLEISLREALQGQQFTLYYQPQVHGLSEVRGAEALIRWQHPQRGMVSPGEFIPLAEDTGLIVPIGLWVLETACTQLARWATDPRLSELHLSVNVSQRQFRQADFVQQVLDTLERTGARPERLRIEITEGLLITQVDEVIAKMKALKAHGVGFELDDFGTGYSSLVYLKQLPLDQLKIDQGFVRDVLTDPNDAAIAKMVILLAQSLGLSVIAEGVETVAQRDFLASQGCLDFQGYLFSRPVPVDEFERWMDAHSRHPS